MSDVSSCSKCGGTIIFRKVDGRIIPLHLSGGCSGKSGSLRSSISLRKKVKKRQKRLRERTKLVESFTIPNVSCPECGASVFYYENEYGSKVFFDELGPPWPKHPCTNNEPVHKSKRGESRSFKQKDVWKRFYTVSLRSEIKNDIIRIHWSGFFRTEEDIWSKDIDFMTESGFDSKDIDLKTVFIAQTKGGRLSISLIKKDESTKHILLTTNKKINIDLGTSKIGTDNSHKKEKSLHEEKKVFNKVSSTKKSKKSKNHQTKRNSHQELLEESIQPIDKMYWCPLCTSTFMDEKKREYHLREHWLYDDLGLLAGTSFKKWMKIVLIDN
jgi:hypothetical protein